jgi:hypothetical protein
MKVLRCFKPGAEKGRVLLIVDLTNAGDIDTVFNQLSVMGYGLTIRHVSYSSGVRVHALLKDEPRSGDGEQLMDEWMRVSAALSPEVTHLWRGEP